MAKSLFNDKFKNWKLNNKELIVNEKNIARKSDIEKYKNSNNLSKQWTNITDEHFMVWMRPSPLPNFRKLWGRIEEQINKGSTITVEVENNYNVSKLFSASDAKKRLIITTVNIFGGKNTFLAIGCLILGGACLILGVVFFIGFKMRAKKEK